MSFLEIFQPGLKHLYEEKARQRMLVIRPSHGGGPPLGIDLDAGTASIAVPDRAREVDKKSEPRPAEAEPPSGQIATRR